MEPKNICIHAQYYNMRLNHIGEVCIRQFMCIQTRLQESAKENMCIIHHYCYISLIDTPLFPQTLVGLQHELDDDEELAMVEIRDFEAHSAIVVVSLPK